MNVALGLAQLSDAISLWTTTRAHSDELWMLYLVMTGAVLGFGFSAAYQQAPLLHKYLVAFGFLAFAAANWNAMRGNVVFNNELVELIQQETADTKLRSSTETIHTNPLAVMLIFHAVLDIVVVSLLLIPHSRFRHSGKP